MAELDRQFSQTIRWGSLQERWGNIIGITAQEMSNCQGHKMGFSKGTLQPMKKNASENKPFTLNQHVKRRMDIL